MMKSVELQMIRRVMGRLEYDGDLLGQLTDYCIKNDICLGRIEAIGAVKKARIGFYDQEQRVYEYINLDQPLEILALKGNISLKDGKPFVHAHITLGDADGRAFGGHLAEGTIVFAGEFIIDVMDGPALERAPDDQTGLALWK